MQMWLISDTHFGHENLYGFTYQFEGKEYRVRQEFSNAAEGDAAMIERWNEKVKPQDHIYHLGDLTMRRGGDWATKLAFVKKLNGHKRLILGNHDHFDVKAYREAGFEKVLGYQVLSGAFLSHIPIHESSKGRFKLNIHGHTHRQPDIGPFYRNICVERTGYAPIALEEVLASDVDQTYKL